MTRMCGFSVLFVMGCWMDDTPYVERRAHFTDQDGDGYTPNDGDCNDGVDMGVDTSAAHVHQMDHGDQLDAAFRADDIKTLLQDIPCADVKAIMNDKRLGPCFLAYW